MRCPLASEPAFPGACQVHHAPDRSPPQSVQTAPLGTRKHPSYCLSAQRDYNDPHVETGFQVLNVVSRAHQALVTAETSLCSLCPLTHEAHNSPAWATLRPLTFMRRRGRSSTSWASPNGAKARSATQRESRAQLSATPSRRAICPSTAMPTLCRVPGIPWFPRPATCRQHHRKQIG